MRYIIETQHEHGDTVYYSRDGKIVQTTVEVIVCSLNKDGTASVYYTVPTQEKKYGKVKKDAVEDRLLFKTPQEVADKILADFNSGSQKGSEMGSET